MRRLFLSSAGIVPETKPAFLDLLGKDPKGLTVAFIPTAAYPELDRAFVQWSVDQIESLGMKVVPTDLMAESAENLKKKLEAADIIWVNGGNTFFLLEQIRKSGFDRIVGGLLDEGRLYVGVSAGSYVACPTVEVSKWKHLDDPEITKRTDLEALHLVDFLIVAHYEKKYEEVVRDGVKTTSLPVVALTDQQAVVVEGESVRVVGTGDVVAFNDFALRTRAEVDQMS